jgi:hypothetical protein
MNSFSTAATYYLREKGESFYLSAGVASEGMVYFDELDFIYEPTPSALFLVGLRCNPFPMQKRVYFDVGIGLNTSKHATMFAFEVLINFALWKER